MTKRPEMSYQNADAIYQGCQEPHIVPWINNTLHFVGQRILRPDVLISDDTLATIRQQFALGKGALIVCNHPSLFDVATLPGALSTLEVPNALGVSEFREASAVAKDSLFRGPLGIISRATGSIPLFRPNSDSYKDLPPEEKTKLRRSNRLALGVVAYRLQHGMSVAFMAEGTNSTIAARTELPLTDIKDGFTAIAQSASDDSSFIMPVAIHYRSKANNKLSPFRAAVAFGEPLTEYPHLKKDIKIKTHERMNEALGRAVAHHQAPQLR